MPKRKRGRRAFLAAWLRSPLTMGAVLPSSTRLARAMAAQVDAARPGTVVELGAGTGVVTNALLKMGVAPQALLVVEREQALYNYLCSHYPHIAVKLADADNLHAVLAQAGVQEVNAIVSSLPLLSMPAHARAAVLAQILQAIGPDGLFVQFTYGPCPPLNRRQAHKHGLVGRRAASVWRNLPPAQVWVYRRAVDGRR